MARVISTTINLDTGNVDTVDFDPLDDEPIEYSERLTDQQLGAICDLLREGFSLEDISVDPSGGVWAHGVPAEFL